MRQQKTTTPAVHPLVAASKRELDRYAKGPYGIDRYGRVGAHSDGTLEVVVSAPLIPRAVAILEMLIKEVHGRGWSIVPKNGAERSGIRVKDELVTFRLSELSTGTVVSRTRSESAGKLWTHNQYRYEPTGILRLELTGRILGSDQLMWRDGRGQKVEELTGDFLDAVGTVAKALALDRRQSEKEAREEERRDRREEAEATMRNELIEQAGNWKDAFTLRDLIAEVRLRSAKTPSSWPAKATARWLKQAEAIAKQSDPFHTGYFERALGMRKRGSGSRCARK